MHTKGSKKIVQEIATRLQEARQQAGLSIKEMAARLGVTRDGYAKNEKGMNILNIESLSISPCVHALPSFRRRRRQ
jgi:DNA-binding XRE family transcriptional regulator